MRRVEPGAIQRWASAVNVALGPLSPDEWDREPDVWTNDEFLQVDVVVLRAALDALYALGQRHAYVTNSTRGEWCDRCGTTWPCEVISTVAFHIGMTR